MREVTSLRQWFASSPFQLLCLPLTCCCDALATTTLEECRPLLLGWACLQSNGEERLDAAYSIQGERERGGICWQHRQRVEKWGTEFAFVQREQMAPRLMARADTSKATRTNCLVPTWLSKEEPAAPFRGSRTRLGESNIAHTGDL